MGDTGYSVGYVKPFSAEGEADADHTFAAGVLAEGLDIAISAVPRSL